MSIDDVDLGALRDLAVTVAAAGGREVARWAGDPALQAHTKSSATDPVTEVDRAVETLVVTAILDARPDDGVIGEEGTDHQGRSGIQWAVDPIDGTVNFLYGIPGCNVSVAAMADGRPLAGAVVDPLSGEVFAAVRGQGATCNGQPLRCSTATDPAMALLGTGFGYTPARRRRQAEILTEVLPHVRDIRRHGAAAVDLAWVGCGRLDGYWEWGLNTWDWAAGALVATEAGAVVSTLDGHELTATTDETCIVAAPRDLHEQLCTLLESAGAASM